MPTAVWRGRGTEEEVLLIIEERQTNSAVLPLYDALASGHPQCMVKDRVFCRITGKTYLLSRVRGKSNCEEGDSLGTGIFFAYHDDKAVFCNLFSLAGKSG